LFLRVAQGFAHDASGILVEFPGPCAGKQMDALTNARGLALAETAL